MKPAAASKATPEEPAAGKGKKAVQPLRNSLLVKLVQCPLSVPGRP